MRIALDAPPHGETSADVERLLAEADLEFIPTLSSRADTGTLVADPDGAGITRYAAAMSEEQWVVATRRREAVGVLSFVYVSTPGAALMAYVTTVIVDRRLRRRGIGHQLYDVLEGVAHDRDVVVLETRTWSTNHSHLGLLARRGFQEIERELDDRGPGIDTVHMVKRLTTSH